MSIPTTLTVGEPLNIGWALNYKNGDPARFGSPGFFGPGGKVLVTGNVQLSGSWVGVLQPKGLVDQPGKLQPGKILKLPDGISDAAHTVQAGTVKVTPGSCSWTSRLRPARSWSTMTTPGWVTTRRPTGTS